MSARTVADLCEACATALVPGVLYPMRTDERDDHAYVERCDECALFVDDVAAAVAVGAKLEKEIKSDDTGVWIEGVTFAKALGVDEEELGDAFPEERESDRHEV